jgi:hypothetical protein
MSAKKVVLNLVGINGNAFYLLGVFNKAALRQGFDQEFIDMVVNEATDGDYDHLLQTLLKYTTTEVEVQ